MSNQNKNSKYQQGTQKKVIPCKWGLNCNNTMDQHFMDFSHPRAHPRARIITSTESSKEVCKFDELGTCRYLNDPNHMSRFAHPNLAPSRNNESQQTHSKPAPQQQPPQRSQNSYFPPENSSSSHGPSSPVKKSAPKPDQKYVVKQPSQGSQNSTDSYTPKNFNSFNQKSFQSSNNDQFNSSNRGGNNSFFPHSGNQPFIPSQHGFSSYGPMGNNPSYGDIFEPQPLRTDHRGGRYNSNYRGKQQQAFYPQVFNNYYPEEQYDGEDEEFYLDEETEKYYDKFLESLPPTSKPDHEEEEFQRDFEEFLREQGCDVGDGEYGEYEYEEQYVEEEYEQEEYSEDEAEEGDYYYKQDDFVQQFQYSTRVSDYHHPPTHQPNPNQNFVWKAKK